MLGGAQVALVFVKVALKCSWGVDLMGKKKLNPTVRSRNSYFVTDMKNVFLALNPIPGHMVDLL